MTAIYILAVVLFTRLVSAENSIGDLSIVPPLPIWFVDANSTACKVDSTLLHAALQNHTLWAQQMWDSSAKASVGHLTGTVAQLGDFDECLAVTTPITAQYCLVDVSLTVPRNHTNVDPLTLDYDPTKSAWEKIYFGGSETKQRLDVLKVALCVPATCTRTDIETSLNTYLQSSGYGYARVSIADKFCTRPDVNYAAFTTGDVAFCVVMGLIILVVTSATVYDLTKYSYDGVSPPGTLIECVSAYRGLKSLFRRDNAVPDLDLSSLYGVHTIAMALMVLSHRFGAFLGVTMTNYESVERIFREYKWSMWTAHMDIFVDLFFVLSGFLLALILSFHLEKGFINLFKVYIHRYIRIVPGYIVIVLFYATLLFKLGDGPSWNAVMGKEQEVCIKYWWANILFVNNYMIDKVCVLQSWYMSCEFQFFLVCAPIVFILVKKPKLGFTIAAFVYLITIISPFFIAYLWNRRAIVWFYKSFWTTPRVDDFYRSLYTPGHTRGSPYIIGMLAGYYVFTIRKKRISKINTWLLFTSGFIVCLLCYWSGCLYYNPARRYNALESALYVSLIHSVWAVGVIMCTLSLLLGTRTFIRDLLSWDGFIPLGKLTFSIYLVHNVVQFQQIGTARAPMTISAIELISATISDYVIAIVLSLFIFLFIEIPTRYLFKHFTSSMPQNVNSRKVNNEEE